jgi:phosphotriesterase-related protein
MLTRREWMTATAAAALAAAAGPRAQQKSIETVRGAIGADRLGLTLMHEHVLVDFIGADKVSPSRYDAADVSRVVLPHLKEAKQLGVETLVECTPAFLGRDPRLLARLSDAVGINILTNTGIYGAANDKHVPAFAFTETAEQLAARWTGEAERGIDGTSIKPAFMKIGVDGAPLSPIDTKLVQAAALTSRRTGLPIASHTGSGAAALEALDLLEAAQAPLTSFIWVHAQSEKDSSLLARAARRGAWVELDGLGPKSVERHLELVQFMKSQQLLDRVLLSHDAGWYHVGEPGGGSFRKYDTLFTAFLPALKAGGFSDGEVRRLVVENPRRALGG